MSFGKEQMDLFIKATETLSMKEQVLSEIVVWLKAKGLWEECKKSLSIDIVSGK